jgi:hypothetical protein
MTGSSLLESVLKYIAILFLYGKWGDPCILSMKKPSIHMGLARAKEKRGDCLGPIIEFLPRPSGSQ